MANEQDINHLPKELPDDPDELEKVIAGREGSVSPLKTGAGAKIVWNDQEKKTKTPFSIVYLHGFKGSHEGGAPIHKMTAQLTGCNLYLARLAEHGKDEEPPLENLTLSSLIRSAADALRVGNKIGDEVILMGTSLGGGLALYLAGTPPFSESVASTVLYSPLIDIYGRYSLFLEHPVSRKLLQMILGDDHIVMPNATDTPEAERIWNTSFHLNGALAIGKFAQKKMTPELFKKVRCPVFAGYYYKNRLHFDRTVSVGAIKKMVTQLGTPRSDVVLENFPNANAHVMSCLLVSDAIKEVLRSTIYFLTHQLPLTVPD